MYSFIKPIFIRGQICANIENEAINKVDMTWALMEHVVAL